MFDGKAFGAEIVGIVQDYMERHLAALRSENEGLVRRVEELEARQPERGEKGENGLDGEPGKDADPEAVRQIVADEVAKAVAEIPPAERGEAGEPGAAGERGEAGKDGKDGCGIKDLLIDREGALVCTLDDGRVKNLGPVVGRDGANGSDGKTGEPGKDGFALKDFDINVIDHRTWEMVFDDGQGIRQVYEMSVPAMIYRDVYKAGETYARGDCVTWGGSLWHCDAHETKEKPGTTDWTLAVKRGRDGKDAKNG